MAGADEVSRRNFLANVGKATVAVTAMSSGMSWASESIEAKVARIVEECPGIDTHNHVDVPLTAAEQPGPEIHLGEELKRSGLAAICMAFATDYQKGDPYDRFLKGMDAMDRQLALSQMQRALSAADLRKAEKQRRPTVIQAIEGCHFLEGKLERVELAYSRGMRQIGLLHDSDATPPLGDVYTNPPVFGGLTEFGASVIRECNRLGILIDLAHADLNTTKAALKVSTAPMFVSHTGLDTRLGSNPRMAEMMRPRLISREQAKMIADHGGLVGVWTHLAETPQEFAENVRAMIEVIGVDHVCIGTDSKLTAPTPRPGETEHKERVGERTSRVWASQTKGFYPTIVEAMLQAGFHKAEIAKVSGGNFQRIYATALRG